jgi:hypothetical protein
LGPKWSESKRGACRKSAARFAQQSRKKTWFKQAKAAMTGVVCAAASCDAARLH